jgi:hypothetical protein
MEQCMKESLKMISKMELEKNHTKVAKCLKALSLKEISLKEFYVIQMETQSSSKMKHESFTDLFLII